MRLADPTMTAPPSGVKVRMYRQGLGDCFLLAFATGGERPFYMLIDCGVLVGTPNAEETMRRVAESVRDATGGRIDVLVATHQHWDHLSGFEQAREVFDRIDVGEVWVAWTEDPQDPLAARLRARRETAVRALWAAARSLRAAGGGDRAETLESVLGFFGELGVDGRPSGLQRALDYVLGRGNPPRYRVPGEPAIGLRGVPGARLYVLGPPQDEQLLLRSDPSRRGREVYEKRLGLGPEISFFAAALAADGASPSDPDDDELRSLSFPFEKAYRVSPKEAKTRGFFQAHYLGGKLGGKPGGKAPGMADISWRRIDDSWLSAANNLALQLDADTNNTSLALAIELSPGGKVLLFPGDAQVGNWLSWHGSRLRWPREGDPRDPVTAEDLLRRTALYKVGHHGSHNATLREKGLELMERPDLVAMIPVDEAMARRPKGGNPQGWDMPFSPLLDRLRQKTDGRVLRADTGFPKPEDLARLSRSERDGFRQRGAETDLYLEITVTA
jgi:hypothetical protein